MASVSEGLTRLHQLLSSLKEIGDQLARGPRQMKVREQQIARLREELAESEAELKQTRAAADKKNLELRTKETHLGDLQSKLNQAVSNREYDIFKGQMAADQVAKAVLEDEIIECLERVDLIQRKIVEARARIAESEQEARAFAQEFENRAAELRQQEAALKPQVADAESVIPVKHADSYRRLVAAYGADALAEASSGVCSHCFVSLTSQGKVQLNSGEILFCNCGRLLFIATENS